MKLDRRHQHLLSAFCLGMTVVRNNSRRVYFSVRHLQTRADSGMMSGCCSWHEQSWVSSRIS
jgi:hypothetical protein